jgi:hypothetical protein
LLASIKIQYSIHLLIYVDLHSNVRGILLVNNKNKPKRKNREKKKNKQKNKNKNTKAYCLTGLAHTVRRKYKRRPDRRIGFAGPVVHIPCPPSLTTPGGRSAHPRFTTAQQHYSRQRNPPKKKQSTQSFSFSFCE